MALYKKGQNNKRKPFCYTEIQSNDDNVIMNELTFEDLSLFDVDSSKTFYTINVFGKIDDDCKYQENKLK